MNKQQNKSVPFPFGDVKNYEEAIIKNCNFNFALYFKKMPLVEFHWNFSFLIYQEFFKNTYKNYDNFEEFIEKKFRFEPVELCNLYNTFYLDTLLKTMSYQEQIVINYVYKKYKNHYHKIINREISKTEKLYLEYKKNPHLSHYMKNHFVKYCADFINRNFAEIGININSRSWNALQKSIIDDNIFQNELLDIMNKFKNKEKYLNNLEAAEKLKIADEKKNLLSYLKYLEEYDEFTGCKLFD